MRISHKISVSGSSTIQKELRRFGIDAAANGLISFEIDESDERWRSVQDFIRTWSAADFVTTIFSKDEIAKANWLEMQPSWHHGYPQPNESAFGYLSSTYDLENYCHECGLGLKQKAPFQLKGEPKWGRNKILQLNWVFDEFFVTPEIWKTIFEPRGIGSREVLSINGALLKTVVQLDVVSEVTVDTKNSESELCTICGRTKYKPTLRGYFPALVGRPNGHMVKTNQYFGSGASASKRIVVSANLASALHDIRGVRFRPATSGSDVPIIFETDSQ